EPMFDFAQDMFALKEQSQAYWGLGLMAGLMGTAYISLLVCLLIHVAMRGLWIAAIGLRYVSGDIDYEALRYQPIYRRWLRGSVGGFDNYIEGLERLCSVMFSIAFLIIFCFLSITTYSIFVILLHSAYGWLFGVETMQTGVFTGAGVVSILTLVLGVLYFIDFLTLGFFKRNRFTAKVYYPLYRLMGWVTLAALYRPLYHNLVDDRFGRRLARMLPFFVLAALFLVSLNIVTHGYFPYYLRDGAVWIDHRNYDDEGADIRAQRYRTTLNSRYAKNNYVEAFVSYRPQYHDPTIERKFPDLDYARYTGFRFGEPMQMGQLYNRDEAYSYDSLLIAVSSMFRVYVDDSLRQDIPARFHYNSEREQPGLLYMVPTHDLPIGEHYLNVETQYIQADTLYWYMGARIYFYK
ncbi:MAG: hypothetical protein WA952_19310, partial [Lewinella sp.]